jgi:hypothetical protein
MKNERSDLIIMHRAFLINYFSTAIHQIKNNARMKILGKKDMKNQIETLPREISEKSLKSFSSMKSNS